MKKKKAEQKGQQGTAETSAEVGSQAADSKYRLILIAAQRSKQLQRGARPRVELYTPKDKQTRIALEEVAMGKVNFTLEDERQIKALNEPSAIGIEKIRSAVEDVAADEGK